jgi:hypothetical protein
VGIGNTVFYIVVIVGFFKARKGARTASEFRSGRNR